MSNEMIHYEKETELSVFRKISTGQWYLETDKILIKIDEATFNRIKNASKDGFQNLKYKCPHCNKVIKDCECE